MVMTIRPHGSIADELVKKITIVRPGMFALIDDCGNWWGISEATFNNLKERGIEIYEIKQHQNRKF